MATSVDVECIVVGGGVIGLAIARALAVAGREVFVLEAEAGIGRGISSRNSEVIHAGLYYPPGSLKARFCVEGKAALYDYCEWRGIAHLQCGKIIVATHEDQHARLAAIQSRAEACGVHDLRWLMPREIAAMEPALRGSGALFSPTSGIVDSHALMAALEGDLTLHGGKLIVATTVVRGRALQDDAIELVTGGPDPARIVAHHVILAGGLFAGRIASSIAGVDPSSIPRLRFAKGNYFRLERRSPFSHLVYPIPEPGGLGIHLTLDLSGRARFGPDVEWLDVADPAEIDYAVDPSRRNRFAEAIRGYWAELEDGDLEPDYSGVRPKLVGRGEPDGDFLIHTAECHGIPGLVALYGIESPGLTSALAIAAHVAGTIEARASS